MPRPGDCLIARPQIANGFFSRSVIFLYENLPQFVSGVVLNKESRYKFSDIIKQITLDRQPMFDLDVFYGGPVNEGSLLLLHSEDWTSANTYHTGTGLDLSSDEVMVEKLCDGNFPVDYKLIQGYSVWAPSQLAAEIDKGYWLVGQLPKSIMFDKKGDDLWKSSIEHIGEQLVQQYF